MAETETKKSHTKRCPKPFEIKNHTKSYEKNLKALSSSQAAKANRIWPEKNLTSASILCFKCRLYIENYKETEMATKVAEESTRRLTPSSDNAERCPEADTKMQGLSLDHSDTQSDKTKSDTSAYSSVIEDLSNLEILDESCESSIEDLNYLLSALNLPKLTEGQFTPARKFVVNSRYQSALSKVTSVFQDIATRHGLVLSNQVTECADCEDLLLSMKQRYGQLRIKEHRYLMLTCAPKSLSYRKLTARVGCKYHEARVAIDLRKQKELNAFVSPSWKSPAHPLNDEFKNAVIDFYLKDSNSRPSPNKRDVRRVLSDSTGEYELKSKRWILVNLQELYSLFLSENPGKTIHVTTFANLRPLWCVWPGRFGHNISCTCITHENFANKLAAIQHEGPLHDFLRQFHCQDPSRDCFMGTCANCPLLEEILDIPTPTEIITTEIWQQDNNKMTKVLVQQTSEEFLEMLQEDYQPFVTHHFVMKEQQRYIDQIKTNLQPQSIIIQVDFAENYAFNVQNAPTSFHWTNTQATLHPFCITYREGNDYLTKTFVIVSDTLEHSAVTFHWFQVHLYKELKVEPWYEAVRSVYYVSDGAGSQYKNKYNFRNLQSHFEDFGLQAEWIFFASGHGKGPCDAASGSIKATAHRAALKGITILSPHELFKFYKSNMVNSTRDFIYVDGSKLDEFRKKLQARLANVETVTGTRKFHSVRASPTALQFRFLSFDETFVAFDLSGTHNRNVPENLFRQGEFVIVKAQTGFVLGRVTSFDEDDKSYHVDLMKRCGQKNNFVWPQISQVIAANVHEILCATDEPTAVGRNARYWKINEQHYKRAANLTN